MASEMKRKRKPKAQPLVRSMHLIEDEHKNVARRTRERISLLCLDLEEEHEYGVDKATQTEIAMHQVHVEIEPSVFSMAVHEHSITKSIIFISYSVTININN